MNKKLSLLFASLLSVGMLAGCGKSQEEYNEEGKMILNIRDLYFKDWQADDVYTNKISEKFNVQIVPTSYSWADWDQQVFGPIQANRVSDVFHFDVDSYNFYNTYVFWAEGEVTKPLPDDLTKWPHLKNAIEKASNIENFYIDGKLYGIPVLKNINDLDIDYSPFTYVYRRDWAKALNVYQEDDEYTWDQFKELLRAFYAKPEVQSGDMAALADVEWGYPSIINFYKDAPHCFSIDADGKVVSTYKTEKYLEGLDLAKEWTSGREKYYGFDQYAANEGDVAKQYYAGRVGVFYENLSLSNYTTLREQVWKRDEITTKAQLDDATAIMKVKGPDGKYALEGTENWFSAIFMSADISDEKMEKILDILDWTLSEEGTMMAAYGFEGYDYVIEDGKVVLQEAGWEKDLNGKYVDKVNGAKYLRYLITLGNDLNDKDPLVDKDALKILNDWQADIEAERALGNLRVIKEDGRVKWLSTPTKGQKSGELLTNAVTAAINYTYGKIDKDAFIAGASTSTWETVLEEINEKLGK